MGILRSLVKLSDLCSQCLLIILLFKQLLVLFGSVQGLDFMFKPVILTFGIIFFLFAFCKPYG